MWELGGNDVLSMPWLLSRVPQRDIFNAALNALQSLPKIFIQNYLRTASGGLDRTATKNDQNVRFSERFWEMEWRRCYKKPPMGKWHLHVMEWRRMKIMTSMQSTARPSQMALTVFVWLKTEHMYKSLLPLLHCERIWWKIEGWVKYSWIW